MIEVRYIDDNKQKHICYISSQKEVTFLQARFGRDNVEVIFL